MLDGMDDECVKKFFECNGAYLSKLFILYSNRKGVVKHFLLVFPLECFLQTIQLTYLFPFFLPWITFSIICMQFPPIGRQRLHANAFIIIELY